MEQRLGYLLAAYGAVLLLWIAYGIVLSFRVRRVLRNLEAMNTQKGKEG